MYDIEKLKICGYISKKWKSYFSNYCCVLPESDILNADLYIHELDSPGINSSGAYCASEHGIKTVLWVTAGQEVFSDMVAVAHKFDHTIVTDWMLYQTYCESVGSVGDTVHYVPEPICYTRHNPFDRLREQSFLSKTGMKKFKSDEVVQDALKCAFSETANGAMAAVNPGGNQKESCVAGLMAENRDILLLGNWELESCFACLTGFAKDKKAALSWAYMTVSEPVRSERIRANAMRETLKIFSPYAVWNRFLNLIGMDTSSVATLWVAICDTPEKCRHALEDFEKQTWPGKKLVLFTDENVAKCDDVMVYPVADVDKPVETWCPADVYLSLWQDSNFYGSEYLSDLALMALYSGENAVAKSDRFSCDGKEILDSQTNSYRSNAEILLSHGLAYVDKVKHYSVSSLETAVISGCVMDGFQFVRNGRNAENAGYYADTDGATFRKPYDEVQAIRKERLKHSIESIMECAGDAISIRLKDFGETYIKNGYFSYQCDFEPGIHPYLRPVGFDKLRLAASPNKSYIPQLQGGMDCILRCKGYLDSSQICQIYLLYYGANGQIGRLEVPVGQTRRFTIPEETMYIVPAIRLSGKGNVCIQDWTIYPVLEQNRSEEPYYAVVTNHYPEPDNLYANMFVHSRVKAYIRSGLNIRVFVVKRQRPGEMKRYTYQGGDVFVGNSDEVSVQLRSVLPKKILVHFAGKIIVDMLEKACPQIPKIVWFHGADVYPAYHRMSCAKNFRVLAGCCMDQIYQVSSIERLLSDEKTVLVPVSQTLKTDIQEDYGVKLEDCRCKVIHNYIDMENFEYQPKKPEQRFKVMFVKSFSSGIYAGDICAAVVHELSKRSCFKKIEFTLLGQGPLFYPCMASLAKFDNVKIHRVFVDSKKLCQLYQENGILLMPTRHDTQGVSRDEAMACGMVPVTNAIAAVPEFVDEDCGVLVAPEDVVGIADAIERLVSDPDRFLTMSRNAAQKVRALSGYDHTLQREIDLIAEETEG